MVGLAKSKPFLILALIGAVVITSMAGLLLVNQNGKMADSPKRSSFQQTDSDYEYELNKLRDRLNDLEYQLAETNSQLQDLPTYKPETKSIWDKPSPTISAAYVQAAAKYQAALFAWSESVDKLRTYVGTSYYTTYEREVLRLAYLRDRAKTEMDKLAP